MTAKNQRLTLVLLALAALEPERFVVIDAEQDLETVARLVAVNVARLVARRGDGLRGEDAAGSSGLEADSPAAAVREAVLRRYPDLHVSELDG